MILSAASALYGAAATWRRQWYARDPARRRRLDRPVVSVGNLSTGGRGKSPVVGAIARLLLDQGEQPAILSRGYARRQRSEGVTVVSDAGGLRAGVDAAGDEPLMLARALPGVPVLVATDRHLAGRLAESALGATVHVLDDGFQHLGLARDLDLVLVDERDFHDRVLPAGRLREPLGALRLAHAALYPASSGAIAERLRELAPDVGVFAVRRTLGEAVWIGPPGAGDPRDGPVFAVAAVARPERFFDDLAAAGWNVAGTRAFRDHHWFTQGDVARTVEAARTAGASAIVTTDKDAVRLEDHPCDLPIARVPLCVSIEPPFAGWLIDRLSRVKPEARSPKPEA